MSHFLVYIFFFLGSFFNACMDAFENENFGESIFKNWNKGFWYKRESWAKAKRVFGYKFDAWHISKSLMILSIILSIIFYEPFLGKWNLLILGFEWNLVFWLFYHKIFKIK